MQNIDKHRNNKVKLFERNIVENQVEIDKLKGYMEERGTEDMHYFYETRIKELRDKIRESKEFIYNIEKRMKK